MQLLAGLAEIRTGYSFRDRLERNPSGNVRVVQMKDIDEANRLCPEELIRINIPRLAEHHLVQTGDLLFRSRGDSYSAALITTDLGRAVLAAPMLLIRIRNDANDAVDPAYLQWFLNHPATRRALAPLAAGTSVKMISKSALGSLQVPLPSVAWQRQIIAIDRLSAMESEALERLAHLRRTVIHEVLMRKAQATPLSEPYSRSNQ